MIDLTEDIIDLPTAARERCFRNSKTGKPAALSQIYRWIGRGARDAVGNHVKLETIRIPSGLRTSREAIQRFIERLTTPGVTPIQSTQSRFAGECADDRLSKAGW